MNARAQVASYAGLGPALGRLPILVPPLPDESLLSFAARLSSQGAYPSPQFVFQYCLQALAMRPGTQWDLAVEPSVLEWFAASSVQAPERIHAMTAHRFARTISSGWNRRSIAGSELPMVSGVEAGWYMRPWGQAQYCSACLAVRPYHRVQWLPYAICACLEHDRVHRSACWRCGVAVSAYDVTAGWCSRCDARLAAEPEPQRITPDSTEHTTQRILRGWLLHDGRSLAAEYFSSDFLDRRDGFVSIDEEVELGLGGAIQVFFCPRRRLLTRKLDCTPAELLGRYTGGFEKIQRLLSALSRREQTRGRKPSRRTKFDDKNCIAGPSLMTEPIQP